MLEGNPFKGIQLEQLKNFLNKMDLEYDEGIEYSICILDENNEMIASGSAEQNVLKCIAIDPEYQGQGLSGTIISQLIQYEFEQGMSHILMYTKPQNQEMFEDMGFYTIIKTNEVLFMENRKGGIGRFLENIIGETPEEAGCHETTAGAIVANCNPFTLGHRYLIEEALKQCDYLHLFVLSDKRTFYRAEERYFMVKEGIRDLERVILHQTSDYLVSAATFPSYFMKDKGKAQRANCRLDVELFGQKIGPALQIKKRFIGTEPYCQVTNCYNETMKKLLPGFGIQVIEIERKHLAGDAISASRVRDAVRSGNVEQIRGLVPETTWEFLHDCIEK